MFHQFKNIDTAFKHIKLFSIGLIAANMIMFCFYVYKSDQRVTRAEDRVLILLNGKVVTATASDRAANLPVELRDHIKSFHELFFTLAPDDQQILSNINKALYLADESAKKEYDNLKENGYYSSLISSNINQRLTVDSITLEIDKRPYYFKCFATQNIVRSTSTVSRSLITEGYVQTTERSDNNPHGFLIERWTTLENKDLTTENRQK